MSINEYLCKNYDEKHKGYVTIDDISKTLGYMFFLFIISYTWFYGLYDYLFNGYEISNSPETLTIFSHDIASIILWLGLCAIAALVIFLVGSFIVVCFGKLIIYILDIKIAKCKLNDEERVHDLQLDN